MRVSTQERSYETDIELDEITFPLIAANKFFSVASLFLRVKFSEIPYK